jgi:hypothetical protein
VRLAHVPLRLAEDEVQNERRDDGERDLRPQGLSGEGPK